MLPIIWQRSNYMQQVYIINPEFDILIDLIIMVTVKFIHHP